MADVISLFEQAVDEWGSRLRAVGADQWTMPTPCTDWDVRALVNHLVYEERWAVPLLAGSTVEEVGDRFDGDLLGDDPLAAWTSAREEALAATRTGGITSATVHVSFGDISGEEYLSQLISDHVIHGWDLARATGGDEQFDPELVQFIYDYLTPQAEGWRAAGVFGPKVEVAAGADLQTELLALTGRQP